MNTLAPLADVTVSDFNALCTKSEGRDKLARFCQYAARFIVGVTAMAPFRHGTRLKNTNELATNVMKQLGAARRTHRWCKEFPVIKTIIQSFPRSIPRSLPTAVELSVLVDKGFKLLQKMTKAMYLMIDHVGWLKQVKILSGGKRSAAGTIQMGCKFSCASNFIGMCYQMKKIRDARQEKEPQPFKQRKFAEIAIKRAFLVVQTAHQSRLYESHTALVGLLGMITSLMDVAGHLPDKKSKICPDAKAMPRMDVAGHSPDTKSKICPDAKAMPR